MLESKDLEIQSRLTIGTLESNAEAIRKVVLKHLEDYTPENYIGRADEAKADKALLNKAEKALNTKRLELEREYMEPFNKFKITITETCKAIKAASAGLDEIVKAEEERERGEKWEKIEEYWNRTGFSLFDITDLSKITDIKKWTNKTAKLKDVLAEIDAIQKKTFDELKILEQFPQEDVSLLKTVYLDTLSITEAMQKANQIKANRERLAREQREREEVERFKKIQEQKKDEWKEEKKAESENESSDLASAALGLEIKPEKTETLEEYALVFSLTRSQFLDLRNYMSDHGITYSELQDKGSGVYTK